MTMPISDALTLRDAAYETGVTDERMGRAAIRYADTLDAPLDRRALVAELRRQVHDADPQDDYLPWRQVMLNLADSLAMTPSFPPPVASIDSGD